jgi:uracil-DNA glycosylase
MQTLETLLADIASCQLCALQLPLGPNPVLRASTSAKVLIAGQAPGIRVHESSIPFNDPSGDRLREWLGVDRDTFYDRRQIAIIPMGFCYPGTGSSGDLPPRPECAATWHQQLMALLPRVELILPIGQYAQRWHLGAARKRNLTETVRSWRQYRPRYLPLPHPSPRNNIWLKNNPWFADQVIPALQQTVATALGSGELTP